MIFKDSAEINLQLKHKKSNRPHTPSLRSRPTHPQLLRADRWAPHAETQPTAPRNPPGLRSSTPAAASAASHTATIGGGGATVADGNAADASSTALAAP